MFETYTEEYLKQDMLSKISSGIDKSEGSFVYDAISPAANEIAFAYGKLDDMLELIFAQTSSGEYLDKRASEFGLIRFTGDKASGNVTFSGVNGAVIPIGTVVQTPAQLRYITVSQGTIASGTVTVGVEAEQIGKAYNVPADTITGIPIAISGVSGVTNAAATTGGEDIESDVALQARIKLKITNPATSGNASHYLQWALEIDGVGKALVFPVWNGEGTVKVVILSTEKKPSDAQLITDVGNYIEANRPIGASVTVETATALPINVSATIQLEAGFTLDTVKANIESKIVNYLADIAFSQEYVSYAVIGKTLFEADGVADYSSLTLNGGTANVTVSLTETSCECPVIGTTVIT